MGKVFTYIAAMVAIFLWGMSFIWTDRLFDCGVPVFTYAFTRMAIAALLLLLFTKFTGKLQKIEPADYKWIFLLGLFEPFLYFIGESFGLKATQSPVVTAVVIATIPLFCIVYERLFCNRKINRLTILGIVMTIPGVLLVALEGGSVSVEHLYGLAFLFLAVFSSIGFSVNAKRLSSKYNSLTIATYQFSIGAVLFLIPFIFGGADGISEEFFTWEVMYPMLMLALFCSCVCFVLWISILRNIGVTRTNIFSALIPVVSAVAAAILGADTMTTLRYGGIAVVIVGVIIAQRD